MVLVPMERISSSTSCLAASPTTTMDTTDAIPIMMPSMVNSVRILLAAMANHAMLNASRKPLVSCCQPPSAGVRSTFAAALPLRAGGLLIISPSRISMTRSAWAAIAGSWVTIITVCPRSRSCFRVAITSSPEWLSSAPVGSSARITCPPFINALAMLTRCCCPPESCEGE